MKILKSIGMFLLKMIIGAITILALLIVSCWPFYVAKITDNDLWSFLWLFILVIVGVVIIGNIVYTEITYYIEKIRHEIMH